MYVATILFTLPMTRIQIMQFAVSISDTPVTVKQNQGHQTYNDNVDPKQGYTLRDLALMVSEKMPMFNFFSNKISLEHVQKNKTKKWYIQES